MLMFADANATSTIPLEGQVGTFLDSRQFRHGVFHAMRKDLGVWLPATYTEFNVDRDQPAGTYCTNGGGELTPD